MSAIQRHVSARRELTQRWYAEGWYGEQTLFDVLSTGSTVRPNTRIIFETESGRRELTLMTALADAERLAAALYQRGIRATDVVAVQLPNWPEALVTYAAIARLGATILPIVHIYGPAETGSIVAQANAKALILPDVWGSIDYLERLESMVRPAGLEHVIVVGDRAPHDVLRFGDLMRADAARVDDPSVGPDERCILLYTSGTTAEPKGVQHSHNSFLTELRTSPTPPQGEAGTVNFQPFPAGHIAGLSALLGPFVHGFTTILMDRWNPRSAAAAIEEFGVTAMSGTPFHIASLLDELGDKRASRLGLRHIVTGGAGVPPALVERADSCGWSVARCYGSSEQPTVTASPSDAPMSERAYSDGSPLPGNDVRIADYGEVLIIGPDQFLGYTNPAYDSDAFTEDGWFRTGDIGTLDSGRLTITDRKKDVIIRGGENISSSEVEAVLARHDAIAEAAVIAVSDDRYGERVGAFVILRPGASIALHDVQELFRTSGMARQKTPEHLFVVDEFPRTAAGKVKKHELRSSLSRASGGRDSHFT